MPEPVYADLLTSASRERLKALVRDLPHPVAIAGGHAVRLRVQEAWRRRFGQEYFGSRDIDLVYLVDPAWTEEAFRESAAGRAPVRIREVGYRPVGVFRFGIVLDADGRVLEAEPGPPKIRGVDFDTLYLDPIVTHVRPDSKKVLGFDAVDEPLLAPVFRDAGLRSILPEYGENVFLPVAPMLVATKLRSLPGRDKEDKGIKDLCDLYALVTYGGSGMEETRSIVHAHLPDAAKLVGEALRSPFVEDAARHLDVSWRDIEAVLSPLALRPR